MTKEDTIRQLLPTEIFIKWLIMIERSAAKNADKLSTLSDEDLAVDWLSFLNEEA